MKSKFIFLAFVLLFTQLWVNGQQLEDSVLYISYISSTDKSTDAFESVSEKFQVYDIFLSIPHLSSMGGRTLMFDGELELRKIPKSAVDTTKIIDWTKSREWEMNYSQVLLERMLKAKYFYFINKERQTDPEHYIVIRAVRLRPKHY